MARVDGNRALEELYRVLMDRQFDFVPRGEQHLRAVYSLVQHLHPEICDDTYLCSSSCKNGYKSPEWQHVARAVLKNVRARGGPIVSGSARGRWVFRTANAPTASAGLSVVEGRTLLRLHKIAERKPAIVLAKKREVQAVTGRLVCEACEFEFVAVYGSLGNGFAECHHRLPFATAGERRTELWNLAVVCANCHRMLHRRPWRTVEALRELIRSRRSGQA